MSAAWSATASWRGSSRDPRHLTLFYLMVSIGGAIGGVFVGLLAPRLFSGYYELPLALVGCAALVLVVLRRDVRDSTWAVPPGSRSRLRPGPGRLCGL